MIGFERMLVVDIGNVVVFVLHFVLKRVEYLFFSMFVLFLEDN